MDRVIRHARALFSGLILLLFISAPFASAEEASEYTDDHINLYYFHGTSRCANCYKIEQYTEEAVEKFFEKELASGRLVYKTIDVDKKENAHFVRDYQLYTKSVVLSVMKDGRETAYKDLEKIWGYISDRERFLNYIKEETSAFLDRLDSRAY